MKLLRLIPTITLLFVMPACLDGKKTPPAPHLTVYDMKAQAWVPLVAADNSQVYVVGPSGIQPGVFAGKSDDGKAILILPAELASDDTPPVQENKPEEKKQNQSGGERLDRAQLLRAGK